MLTTAVVVAALAKSNSIRLLVALSSTFDELKMAPSLRLLLAPLLGTNALQGVATNKHLRYGHKPFLVFKVTIT